MNRTYVVAVRRDRATFYLELTHEEMSHMAKLVRDPQDEKVAMLAEALTTIVERAIATGRWLEREQRTGAEIVGEVEARSDLEVVNVRCPDARPYEVEIPAEVENRVCRRMMHLDDGTPCAEVVIGVATDFEDGGEGTKDVRGRSEPFYVVRYLHNRAKQG